MDEACASAGWVTPPAPWCSTAQGKEIQHIAGLATVHGDTPERLDYARYFCRLPHGAGGECDLLSNADGKLRLTRGGIEAQHLVWEWPLPGVGDIMEVLGEGEHTTVVVRSGKTAYGLDGATGKERWRCFGPRLPTGLLRAADAAAPPLVLFAENGAATTCRRALEVGPDGHYIFPAAEKISPSPLPEDPRLRVLLPWWQALHDRSGFDWAVFLLVQAGTILAVVVGRSAAWLLRRRAWVIGLLLCLVLAVVLAPSIWLSCVPSGVRVWSVLGLPPLAVALQGLPALVFVWQAFAWAVQRRLAGASACCWQRPSCSHYQLPPSGSGGTAATLDRRRTTQWTAGMPRGSWAPTSPGCCSQ